MNPLALELNNTIKENNAAIFEMLSKKGKEIFFPEKGILTQSAQAKGKEINATIGMALEDNGEPMVLSGLTEMINMESAKKGFTYASSYGLQELREIWKENMLHKNDGLKEKAISSPVVTNALTHGLSVAGYLFLDEDDVLISPDLYWGNYRLIFQNA